MTVSKEELMEVVEIVAQLNDRGFETVGCAPWSVETNSEGMCVMLYGVTIWDSEDDERKLVGQCGQCNGSGRVGPTNPMEQTGGTPDEYQAWARSGGDMECPHCGGSGKDVPYESLEDFLVRAAFEMARLTDIELYKLLGADWPDEQDAAQLPSLLRKWAACFGPCTSYYKPKLVRALCDAADRIEALEGVLNACFPTGYIDFSGKELTPEDLDRWKQALAECGAIQMLPEGISDGEVEPWRWMRSGDNDLDSMGTDMAILITAGELRELLEAHTMQHSPGGHVFDSGGRCACGHTTKDDPERCPLDNKPVQLGQG